MGIISEILIKQFETIYCDTCANIKNENICDNCHRKSMMWSLNPKVAKDIEEKILIKLEENAKHILKGATK